MDDFSQAFEERLQEIEAYLDLLDALEKQVQDGVPKVGGTGPTITVQQQRILYSSVYLQLYNLVESTMTRCLEALSTAVGELGPWRPTDLSDELRREWVRSIARTHIDLSYENRLESALSLCNYFTNALPISEFKVERGGGGNWDDEAIHEMSKRLGLSLNLTKEAMRGAKQKFRNDQGPLAYVRSLRNNLAHGSQSFAECGEGVTASELRELKDRTALYLRDVVAAFKRAIDSYEFLLPEKRPQRTGPTA